MAGIGLGHLLGRDDESTSRSWGGSSSLVKTEPLQIVLLLLFRTQIERRNVYVHTPTLTNSHACRIVLCRLDSAAGSVSAHPVGRPTRDGQLPCAIRQSPIIGPDTLLLQTPG